MSKVSLIIPTYNERDNITPLVERIHKALSGNDYRILFVDDNSKDGTAEIAGSLSNKYPVDVLVRKDKRGLASAIVDGLERVDADIVAVIDADLQHPPELLSSLLEALDNGADIAIASRYVPGGGCEGWNHIRRIMSKGAILIAHLLLPSTRSVKDPMSGYFMFRKRGVTDAKLNPLGYKILLEILLLGNFDKVAEVPYIFRTRTKGESKLNTRQQVEYLKHVYSLMRRTGELWRFVKFCMVGGSGVGVDEGMLYLLAGIGGLRPVELASALSAETAIISNFTLNDIFTFRDRRSPGVKAKLNRFWKFNLICLAGVGIKVGVLSLLYNFAGMHYLLANLVGIAVATLWNYLLNTWVTWR
ncbi:MAG: glycosyltransferase [Chloroflexi bacterium]|nr:glycosyltransferase [Chloroflexota bacterium]